MDSVFEIFRFIGVLLLVLLVFNVIILVHEWGHFLAARWRGLKIEKFQIWFGKPIWKRTWNGVQYGLGSIPAGGFVALPQMAPMEAIEGGSEAGEQREKLPPISPLDKIIVAFAGPLFSFLLAFGFAVLVWMVGKPVDEFANSTTIGYVVPGKPAEGKLQMGDKILKVDGMPVEKFFGMVDSVVWGVVSSPHDAIVFTVDRPGIGEIDVPVQTPRAAEVDDRKWYELIFKRPQTRKVGIGPAHEPAVFEILPNSPAEEGGLMKGDLVKAIDGAKVYSAGQIEEVMGASGGNAVALTVLRDGNEVTVNVTPRVPRSGTDKPHAGVYFTANAERTLQHPSPVEQVSDGLRTMANTIGAVLSSESDVSASHLSGPVGIWRVYINLFQMPDGWRLVLWFSVILNVNLAILNLLPFPVLDGGHITMAILELIRRKPLNFKVLEIVQFACVMLLFGFMIFVSLKDVGDIGDSGEPAAPIEFEPSPGGGAP
jgi:regulator of sigma E protease